MKTTTVVCSSAYEASIGGQDAAIARGRAARAGTMMVIEEDADVFSITEELGGKLIRLSLPRTATSNLAEDYGLQLAATLLSDEHTVASGDRVSADLYPWRAVAQTDATVFVNGPTGTGKEVLAKFIHHHPSDLMRPSWP